DMKPIRVTISASVVAAFLFVVFFIPLPVTRINVRGFVQVQPTEVTQVAVEVPGILKTVYVIEGQQVKKGQILAEFYSLDLEQKRDLNLAQMEISDNSVKAYNEQIAKEFDETQKSRLSAERGRA